VTVDASSPAPKATLSPYDLEADIRARITAARKELDASAAPVQVVGGLYVFVAADHGGPLFDETPAEADRAWRSWVSALRFQGR
jgi:hypothetical protein